MLQSKSVGRVLFDSVVCKLQLLESDYFGLEYVDDELMPVSSTVCLCCLSYLLCYYVLLPTRLLRCFLGGFICLFIETTLWLLLIHCLRILLHILGNSVVLLSYFVSAVYSDNG